MTITFRTQASRPALLLRGFAATLATVTYPALAHAHHDMDGETPATFMQGLLSGLAHPVIGKDHLAMILLVGAYCGATRQGYKPLFAFVGAAILGCLLHVARLDLPQVETGIAVSLVILGLVACAAIRSSVLITATILALVGTLHGYAYGESIVGAEPTPLVAYLVGLSLVQGAIASVVLRAATPRAEQESETSRVRLARVVGVVSAVVGVVALTVG